MLAVDAELLMIFNWIISEYSAQIPENKCQKHNDIKKYA
jgi:hypothetical protein